MILKRIPPLPCAALALLLAACTRPQPPDTDRPPEPQAGASAQANRLRDAIHAPLERARAVEATMQAAAQRQQAAIDAAAD